MLEIESETKNGLLTDYGLYKVIHSKDGQWSLVKDGTTLATGKQHNIAHNLFESLIVLLVDELESKIDFQFPTDVKLTVTNFDKHGNAYPVDVMVNIVTDDFLTPLINSTIWQIRFNPTPCESFTLYKPSLAMRHAIISYCTSPTIRHDIDSLTPLIKRPIYKI